MLLDWKGFIWSADEILNRYLTWKAAHRLLYEGESYDDKKELALEAKVYCSDAAVKSAIDAINLVGV